MLFKLFLVSCVIISLLLSEKTSATKKYRLCVVDGKGAFRKILRLCPHLDSEESLVECIVGIDRLDCLQKVNKGKADFAVVYSEDLIIALNFAYDILIVAELRFTKNNAEYDVAIVSRKNVGIDSIYQINKAKLCHPGFGNEPHWSKVLFNVLDEKIVPKICDPSLTMIENRIKASSKFFAKACKAGPWIHSKEFENFLKMKYQNLCDLCYDKIHCSVHDKYWGRTGTLYCLTDGQGDLSLARLDDINSHFGTKSVYKAANPSEYQFLCPDGSSQDLNNSCIWASKPWPVIVAKSNKASSVYQFLKDITQNDLEQWQRSMLDLVENYNSNLYFEQYIVTIEKFLTSKRGFLSAYSFSGCHPNHAVKLCTISNLENQKCLLLKEAAQVRGLEPSVECVKLNSKDNCMEMIQLGQIDLVFIEPNQLKAAKSIYKLRAIFYEQSPLAKQYLTTIYIKKDSKITEINALKNSKICVPKMNGIADITIRMLLNNELQTCSDENIESECYNKTKYIGELGSLKCLFDNKGEAVVLNSNSFQNSHSHNLRPICPNNKTCTLSWSYPSIAMVSDQITEEKSNEILSIFYELDQLFGRNYKEIIPTFQIFSLFNGKRDVLFHSSTLKFVPNIPKNNIILHYGTLIDQYLYKLSSSKQLSISYYYLLLIIFYFL